MIGHFATTLHAVAPILIVGALVWMAAWTVLRVYEWSCLEVARMVDEALCTDWEDHVADALALTETPIFDRLAMAEAARFDPDTVDWTSRSGR